MPVLSPPNVPTRAIQLGLISLLLLASTGLTTLAQSMPTASPVAGETRLYIGHDARLTAQMPAGWEPDASLFANYQGSDGFIFSWSLPVDNADVDSIEAQCDIVAGTRDFDHAGIVEPTTWRGQDACRIGLPDGGDASIVALVFTHPNPSPDGYNRYVVVAADAAHFDGILESIAFDPSLVTPQAYLDAALDLIETSWLWRDDVDWNQLRADAHAVAGDLSGADDVTASHPAIEYVIAELTATRPDRYSFFASAEMVAASAGSPPYDAPYAQELPGGIGYLASPSLFFGADDSTRYIADMHAAIDGQRDAATCGWILDLRGNVGGDLHGMIGALTPLLEPGTLFTFRDAAGNAEPMGLTADGAIAYDGQPLTWLSDGASSLDPELAAQPVAVLVDDQTGSAGEHLTIAFRGQPGTRVFGQQTFGAANAPLNLSLHDGAYMSITSAWVTGPLGAIYPNGLVPDEIVSTTVTGIDPAGDDAVIAASEWLQSQPGCSAATPAA